jgi:DUF1680 family protein
MVSRRQFNLALAGAAAAWPFKASTAGAAGPRPPGMAPSGELAERIRLTSDRLTTKGLPRYTQDFILADVALDRQRRFTDFSGDLSGRYVEALSLLPPDPPFDLAALVAQILTHQRPDGRFGDPSLAYTAEAIAAPHMALLWGNGRLLLGLTQFHSVHGGDEVLRAAVRLADFLVGVRKQCADPAVAERLLGQGAFGIICFTQLVEPLALLAHKAGRPDHLAAAREIVPLLGARGIQHAHGYLTTLRGMVTLSEATGESALLDRVETLYREYAGSPDLPYLGGSLEYFGWEDPAVSEDQRRSLAAASGRDPRDEGCAVADMLRLSLQLWKATGRSEYLQRAERCLLNHFYFNQFSTGDFGHHVFARNGIKPTESVGRAWWCCTMHGHRAFRDVLDAMAAPVEGGLRVDLFQDGDWSGDGFDCTVRYRAESPVRSRLTVEVRRTAGGARTIALRRPSWATAAALLVNGAPEAPTDGDYWTVRRSFAPGSRIEMVLDHRITFETRDRQTLEAPPEGDALLFVGPWLYAVDDGLEPLFFSEPWMGESTVTLHPPFALPALAGSPRLFTDSSRHLAASYTHGGFAGEQPLVLRPIAEQAGGPPGAVATWLRYRHAGPGAA